MSSSFQSSESSNRKYAPAKPVKLSELYADLQREEDARSLVGISEESNQGQNSAGSAHFASDEEWDRARAEQRAELDNLWSTTTQKEIYGTDAWEKNFQLVETLESILPHGKAAVTELWNDAYWNHPTQRFQRLFANRPHYIIPGALEHVDAPGVPVDLQASGTWVEAHKKNLRFQMKSAVELVSMSCLGCFVDVDRIPPKLAQDLGLITWNRGEYRGDLAVLTRLKKDEIALQLKLIYESLEWLDGEHRVGIVQEPKAETLQFLREKLTASRPDLLPALTIPEIALGQVVYISEEKSGQTTKARRNKKELLETPLKMQVFRSIYDCSRAPLHSSGTYKQERKDLAEPLGRIRQFRVRLEKEWTREASTETKEQLKKDLQQLIIEIAPKFRHAQNLNKTKVRDLLQNIEQSVTDDHRLTPRAKSAQLLAAENNLAVRGRESNRKHSYRTRDGGALQATIEEWQGVFDDFAANLRSKKNCLRQRPALGGKGSVGKTLEQDKKDLVTELTLSLDAFSRMKAEPFRSFVAKLSEARAKMGAAIESGQRKQVERVLIKMDLVCRLQKAQEAFETIKRLTLKDSGVTVSDLQLVARLLESSLPETPTFGKKTYREVFKEYDALRTVAHKITERLDDYANKPLTLPERDAMAKRLRKHIKSFDLKGAVGSIT
jgi:hypothetical protein